MSSQNLRGDPFLSKNSGEMILVGGSSTGNSVNSEASGVRLTNYAVFELHQEPEIRFLSFRKDESSLTKEPIAPPKELASIPPPKFPEMNFKSEVLNQIMNENLPVLLPSSTSIQLSTFSPEFTSIDSSDMRVEDKAKEEVPFKDIQLIAPIVQDNVHSTEVRELEREIEALEKKAASIHAQFAVEPKTFDSQASTLLEDNLSHIPEAGDMDTLKTFEFAAGEDLHLHLVSPPPQMTPGTVEFDHSMTEDLPEALKMYGDAEADGFDVWDNLDDNEKIEKVEEEEQTI